MFFFPLKKIFAIAGTKKECKLKSASTRVEKKQTHNLISARDFININTLRASSSKIIPNFIHPVQNKIHPFLSAQ